MVLWTVNLTGIFMFQGVSRSIKHLKNCYVFFNNLTLFIGNKSSGTLFMNFVPADFGSTNFIVMLWFRYHEITIAGHAFLRPSEHKNTIYSKLITEQSRILSSSSCSLNSIAYRILNCYVGFRMYFCYLNLAFFIWFSTNFKSINITFSNI